MGSISIPLTPFERFLLCENRPAYPCSIFARLMFSGRVDCHVLEAAVRMIMERHPLLASLVAVENSRPAWRVQAKAFPEIVWSSGPTRGAFPQAGYQDLGQAIGLRIFVVDDGTRSDLTVQAHHACCDGAGILVFVNDLLIAYAIASGAPLEGLQLPRLDADRLHRRGSYGLNARQLLKLLPRQWMGLAGLLRFFARSPSPLLPNTPRGDEEPPPHGYPAIRAETFTEDDWTGYRRAASRLNVSTNNLLTRDVFLALSAWRARHGISDDAWLRMMVPMNFRSSRDRFLPAANAVGSVFLDRRGSDFADPDRLLAGIGYELELIKERRLGLIFIYVLHLLRFIPGALRHNARRKKCTVTTIFSNVGEVLSRCPLPKADGCYVVGNLLLEAFDGMAPIRPYNCVTFTATEYAGRLTMTVHYDPDAVTAEQAGELTAIFASRFRMTAGATA